MIFLVEMDFIDLRNFDRFGDYRAENHGKDTWKLRNVMAT